MHNKLICQLAALLLIMPAITMGTPVPILDLPRVLSESELIVTGRIAFVVDAGPASRPDGDGAIIGRRMEGLIRIDRVLKGHSEGDPRFSFVVSTNDVGHSRVLQDEYRLFFLTGTGAIYEFANPYHPSVPAVERTRSQRGDLLVRVLEEIGAVVRDRNTASGDKVESIDILARVKHPASIAALRSAARSQDRSVQQTAIVGLVVAGDTTAFPTVEDILLHRNVDIPQSTILSLQAAIQGSVDSVAAIPFLERLLKMGDPPTKRSAAAALRHTKSPAAVRSLVMGLHDADMDVQCTSILGLAEITSQRDWGPSTDAFARDPQRYLTHWRDWAAKNAK